MAVRKINNSWWVDFQFGEKRYRRRSPDNRREGATAFEHVLRRQLADGKAVYLSRDPRARDERRASAETLADFLPQWFDTYVKTNLKPSTQTGYANVLRRYVGPFFGRYELGAITTHLVEDFKTKEVRAGRSPKTVNNALSVLRRALSEALEWGRLEKLPRFKFLVAPPPTFDFLNPSESAQLLAIGYREPWHLMIRCALRTGMRFGELLGLRWQDVDFERNLIVVQRNVVDGTEGTPKNNRFRQIPMTGDLRSSLLFAPRLGDRVFVLARWLAASQARSSRSTARRSAAPSSPRPRAPLCTCSTPGPPSSNSCSGTARSTVRPVKSRASPRCSS
jgi:integrase